MTIKSIITRNLAALIVIIIYVIFIILYYDTSVFEDNDEHVFMLQPDPGRQNVHDSNVQDHIWKKYDRLVEENKKPLHELYIAAKKSPNILKRHTTPLQYRNIEKVIKNMFANNNLVVRSFHNPYNEKDIYAHVFDRYNSLAIDWSPFITQIADCVDEDGFLYCLTGRVTRYMSVFEGMTDNYLGKPEVTEPILFQSALNRTSILINEMFELEPEMDKLYNTTNITSSDEIRLLEFLETVKSRLNRRLINEFPDLKINRIAEIVNSLI